MEGRQPNWLESCSDQERLKLFGLLREWALNVSEAHDLDPLASREMYGVFARRLADHYGADLTADRDLSRRWYGLTAEAQARCVSDVGTWLQLDPLGAEAAQVISTSLNPPRFTTLAPSEQRSLVGQIGGEIVQRIEVDPHAYGSQTPTYRALARACHWFEGLGESSGSSPLRWDHIAPVQRAKVLGQIGSAAQRALSGSARLDLDDRLNLEDLVRCTKQLVTPYRSLLMRA